MARHKTGKRGRSQLLTCEDWAALPHAARWSGSRQAICSPATRTNLVHIRRIKQRLSRLTLLEYATFVARSPAGVQAYQDAMLSIQVFGMTTYRRSRVVAEETLHEL
jgi:hypothetical protein